MFPDFPSVKQRANRQLLRWVKLQIPKITPILGEVTTFRQHEGRSGKIRRSDDSESRIDYPSSEFKFELTREEMRSFDLPRLKRRLEALAREIGDAESRQLFQRLGEEADRACNTIDAGGQLSPVHLLETFRGIRTDFDPQTLKPVNQVFVMHPSTLERVLPKMKEWETDPEFRAEYDEIMQEKLEEWRAREARRKLVD